MKNDVIELQIAGITLGGSEDNPRVILQSRDRDFTIYLPVGPFEAGAIIVEMEKVKTPVPLTHDSFAGFLTRHGFHVDHLLLHTFMGENCLAQMVYRKGLRKYAVDINPSDGIALAIRLGAHIYISSREKSMYLTSGQGITDGRGRDHEILPLGDGKLQSFCLH